MRASRPVRGPGDGGGGWGPPREGSGNRHSQTALLARPASLTNDTGRGKGARVQGELANDKGPFQGRSRTRGSRGRHSGLRARRRSGEGLGNAHRGSATSRRSGRGSTDLQESLPAASIGSGDLLFGIRPWQPAPANPTGARRVPHYHIHHAQKTIRNHLSSWNTRSIRTDKFCS